MIDEMKINAIQREKYLSEGYWKDITLLDCWKESVKKYSEREYVVDDRGNRYTYRQMDEAASKVAAFLRKQGVLPGDAVSFQLPIWSEFVVVTIACFMTGAVAHPIAMSYEEKELIRSMNLTESKVYFGPSFFHKTDYASRILAVRERIPSLSCVVIVGGEKPEGNGVLAFTEIMDQADTEKQEIRRTGEDLALILCTSGTTSGTKGVLLTHNNIRYSEEVFTRELGLTSEDIMFMPAPLNHATGFHHGLIAPMLIGAKVVLQQKYRCREAIDLMNRERCTFSMGATPFIYDILRELENGGGELPFLKLYLCGGAPVPGYMVRKAWSFGILLCEVYGSTESVPHVFVRPDEALELNGTTSGRPVEGVQIRVVDDEGNDVPPGVPGEELSRGPNVFVGYLKDKKITDSALDDDGWFHSGDLCVMDEAGNIRIIGRKKDMIVRSEIALFIFSSFPPNNSLLKRKRSFKLNALRKSERFFFSNISFSEILDLSANIVLCGISISFKGIVSCTIFSSGITFSTIGSTTIGSSTTGSCTCTTSIVGDTSGAGCTSGICKGLLTGIESISR